jgi:phospholipid/cholesterol/gamma-HCH transport system substrate-binding protein
MKIRFNKFEKVAGIFVLIAGLSCILGMTGIAIKNGWFSRKVRYSTQLDSADGVHAGTIVQIAGLRVGAVTSVDLQSDDKVLVRFEVLEKFRNKVREDSHMQMFRPFILAEKVLEISVGSDDAKEMPVGQTVPLTPSADIMDMLSGKKMGTMFQSFDKLADSLRIVGEAFANPERTHAMVQMLDRLNPLVQNLNTMSLEIVKLTNTANKHIVPSLNREVPDIGQQLGQMIKNTNVLINEFQKLTPAISVIAPELPRTTKRAVEALDETVILLKAMQRSFLLRGKVEEIRQEEGRRPANTSEP